MDFGGLKVSTLIHLHSSRDPTRAGQAKALVVAEQAAGLPLYDIHQSSPISNVQLTGSP